MMDLLGQIYLISIPIMTLIFLHLIRYGLQIAKTVDLLGCRELELKIDRKWYEKFKADLQWKLSAFKLLNGCLLLDNVT